MPNDLQDLERRIRERAYHLWLRAGEPPNLADEFWRSAEAEILQTSNDSGSKWADISPKIVKDDNAKILLERADALIKGQDDGMRAMESRMSSLLGINVTLGTAAIAAAITALGTTSSLGWVQPWTVPALSVLVAFWIPAILVAAVAMMGRQWAVPGVSPMNLYRADRLSGNTNQLRLNLSRTLQDAVEENKSAVASYARILKTVVILLAGGPVAATVAVIWCTRSIWIPLIVKI